MGSSLADSGSSTSSRVAVAPVRYMLEAPQLPRVDSRATPHRNHRATLHRATPLSVLPKKMGNTNMGNNPDNNPSHNIRHNGLPSFHHGILRLHDLLPEHTMVK